jgi:hypothetical protein
MAKTISDRVRDSFKDDDRENIYKYLEWCRSAIQEYAQVMRRMATGILLLAALFEVVANTRNTSVSIGSFHITRGSIVFNFLPVVVAYLFLQISTDYNKADQLVRAFSGAFSLWSKEAESNDLDLLIQGPMLVYWNPYTGRIRDVNQSTAGRVEFAASAVLTYGILLAILAFEAHAYYALFPTSFDALWLISVCSTLFCLIMSIAALRANNS